MSARDEFSARLLCPDCGRSGVARLSELDGYSYLFSKKKGTRVDEMPEGFLAVDQPSRLGGIDIYCSACNVSALA